MTKACADCDTTTTPQWRGDLCNACGIRAFAINKKANGGVAPRRRRSSTKLEALVESCAPPHILLPQSIMHTLTNTDVKAAYAKLLLQCR